MELFAAKSKAYFAAAGGEVSLDVTTTNVDEWDVESTAAWVTAVKDGDKVKITAAPFGTAVARLPSIWLLPSTRAWYIPLP